MKRLKKLFALILAALALFLVACGNSTGGQESADTSAGETSTDQATEESESETSNETTAEPVTVTVGVVGEIEHDVWAGVAERLAEEGEINLEIEVFTDYVQPNAALSNGDVDLNAFQHMAFLQDYNTSANDTLTPIGYTYISAMAAYSQEYEDLQDLPDGAEVTIPNDPTNGGRALLLLEQAGLIEIDDEAGITPTVEDIVTYHKDIQITEVDAAQVPRTLADADAIVANTNYAVDAGLDPFTDGIFVDTNDLSQVGDQYKCVIAVRAEDTDNEIYRKVVEAYNQPETEEAIKEASGGADQRAWEEDTTPESVQEDYENL